MSKKTSKEYWKEIDSDVKKTLKLTKEETQEEESSTTPHDWFEKQAPGEELNGEGPTDKNLEPVQTPGTKELSTPKEENSLSPESGIVPSMGLRDHLETLRQASLGSMNLLDDTTLHLHGLMKQVSKDSNSSLNQWERDGLVKRTVDVARELTKSMRLKLDTVKALHKMSKDMDGSQA